MWTGEPTWSHVLLSSCVRLHVALMDEDVSEHDPIGAFELSERDFARALETGRVYHVKVADQTYDQVLFAGIVVRASSGATALASRNPWISCRVPSCATGG